MKERNKEDGRDRTATIAFIFVVFPPNKIEYNFKLISFEKFLGATNVTSKQANEHFIIAMFEFVIVQLRANQIEWFELKRQQQGNNTNKE